jgi:NAD(P)-dependent dehydrogenase (short-subunit alcohol dehydrogenase family)
MSHGRFDNPIIASLAGFRDLFRKQDLSVRLRDADRLDGRTCIVTGANSGLGFALAVDFAKRGGRVIMACRSQIPEAGEKVKKLSGSDLVEMRYLDLSKIEVIHAFVDGLKKDGIFADITILNAGVALPTARKTDSGLDEIFLVNYLSNVILTTSMLQEGVIPNKVFGEGSAEMTEKPRIIVISSDSHRGSSSIDWEEFGKYFEYGLSKGMNNYSYYKLVLNTWATELSRRLNPGTVDVPVHVICPGPVNTNIIREAPWLLRLVLRGIFSVIFKSPEEAAKAVVYMALSDDYSDNTNQYLHMFNKKRMDEKCYDEAEGKKLWERSMDVWSEVDSGARVFS